MAAHTAAQRSRDAILDRIDTLETAVGAGLTIEDVQDNIGGILVDSSTIDFTYSDATPSITAIVKPGSITSTELSASYQPLDSDLTAIAALTTTSYGRALLELANAAAGRTAFGLGTAAVSNTGDFDAAGAAAAAQAASQPLDSDLTAIAALATTAYGRAFLTLADAAAARTALALGTLATQSGTFSGTSSGTNTGDQTNITGNAATVTTNANLTGPITSVGNATTVADAELAAIAGLTSAADKLPYFTGSGTAALADFTAAGRALVDDADSAAQRTTLNVLAQTQFHLTADATGITSTTPANVTSVVLAVASGLYYSFEFSLIVRTDALTFSPVVAFTTPTFNVLVCEVIGPTGVAQAITASGGSVTVAALPSTNTDYLITVKGIINPSAAGNIRPQLAVSAALGTLTCRRATAGVLTLLTA